MMNSKNLCETIVLMFLCIHIFKYKNNENTIISINNHINSERWIHTKIDVMKDSMEILEFQKFHWFYFWIDFANSFGKRMLSQLFNACRRVGIQQIVCFIQTPFICRNLYQLFLLAIWIFLVVHCKLLWWLNLLV